MEKKLFIVKYRNNVQDECKLVEVKVSAFSALAANTVAHELYKDIDYIVSVSEM